MSTARHILIQSRILPSYYTIIAKYSQWLVVAIIHAVPPFYTIWAKKTNAHKHLFCLCAFIAIFIYRGFLWQAGQDLNLAAFGFGDRYSTS